MKITLDVLKEAFAKRGCKLLTETYEGNTQFLTYIAACGHDNRMQYRVFSQGCGTICRDCVRKSQRAKKLVPYETVKKYFSDNGCTLISKEYSGALKFLEYRCRCGHLNRIRYSAFKQGEGRICPICVNALKKKSGSDVEQMFLDNGCKMLDEYSGAVTKVHYIAQCGHIHYIRPNDFKSGYGRLCPVCAVNAYADNLKLTIDEVRNFFESEGCKLITDSYENCRTQKFKYVCRCGHENDITFAYFKRGAGRLCPLCRERGFLNENRVFELLTKMSLGTIVRNRMVVTKWPNPLFFDFYIPEKNLAIEYNGPQHYRFVEFMHKNEQRFDLQRMRDECKRDYCKENNVAFLEIDGREISIFKKTLTFDWLNDTIKMVLENRHDD